MGVQLHQSVVGQERERRITGKLDRLAALLRAHTPHRLTSFWDDTMARRKKAPETLSDAIRAAIKARGETIYAIAKTSGLDHGQLTRFINGQRTLTLPTAERLCAALELRLMPVDPKAE